MDDIKVMGIIFGVSVFIGLVIIAVDFIAKRLFNVKAKDEEDHSVLQDYNLGKIKVYYFIIVLLTGFGFLYSVVSYNINSYSITKDEAKSDFNIYYNSLTENGYTISPVKSKDNDNEYSEKFLINDGVTDYKLYLILLYDKSIKMNKLIISVKTNDLAIIKNRLPKDVIIDLYNKKCIKKIEMSDFDNFWIIDRYNYKYNDQNISEYEFDGTFGTTMQLNTSKHNDEVEFVIMGFIKE